MSNDDPWANLQSDMLNQIVKYIHSYEDYARLRLVCKPWSLTLTKTPEHKYPWLVTLPSVEDSIETHGLREKEINQMRLPQMQNHVFRGSSCGFLVILGLLDGSLHLLNPFTKVSFDLSPISTLPDIANYLPDYFVNEYVMRDMVDGSTATVERIHMNNTSVYKIIISSPPDRDTHDFRAVVIYGDHCRLGFYRLAVVIYQRRKHHLAAHGNGRLLMVGMHYAFTRNPGSYAYQTNNFNIYMLTKNEPEWSRLYNLGNYALVLGLNSSISTIPQAFTYTKPNHIYYTDNLLEHHHVKDVGGHDIGVFDLESGSNSQLFPAAQFLLPPPVWLCQ
ncbi:uncharacterized protein LOC113870461 [Abrus precatorius]|uniref:Uncharacterized protein LOC113870461 n=1 Tax=Abrus precatorius TaxID=3816 RepID=A0A8B8M4G9_ABRPR|nr:uncharacterized protein LOC113870461 [Abrus precatorius]